MGYEKLRRGVNGRVEPIPRGNDLKRAATTAAVSLLRGVAVSMCPDILGSLRQEENHLYIVASTTVALDFKVHA